MKNRFGNTKETHSAGKVQHLYHAQLCLSTLYLT